MSETPNKSGLPVNLPPRVNILECPPPSMQVELVEILRSQQFMRVIAWNGVLNYHAEMSTIEPDKYSPGEIIDFMRKSSEFQSDLVNGKITLMPTPKKEDAGGENYTPADEDCDRIFDALYAEVSADSIEDVKKPVRNEYAPGARKRPPQKPVEAKVEGAQGDNTPHIEGNNNITPEHQVGMNLSDSSAGSSRERTVKVRRVVKTPTPRRS